MKKKFIIYGVTDGRRYIHSWGYDREEAADKAADILRTGMFDGIHVEEITEELASQLTQPSISK
jgi:hypothetical protein